MNSPQHTSNEASERMCGDRYEYEAHDDGTCGADCSLCADDGAPVADANGLHSFARVSGDQIMVGTSPAGVEWNVYRRTSENFAAMESRAAVQLVNLRSLHTLSGIDNEHAASADCTNCPDQSGGVCEWCREMGVG